jgi:hypothetical protein
MQKVPPLWEIPESICASGIQLSSHPHKQFDVRLALHTPSYVMQEMRIESDDRIESQDVNTVPVPAIVEFVVRQWLDEMQSELMQESVIVNPKWLQTLKGARLSSELLQNVAIQASFARLWGGASNQRVMSMFGVPQRTATRWIARATAEGLLDASSSS